MAADLRISLARLYALSSLRSSGTAADEFFLLSGGCWKEEAGARVSISSRKEAGVFDLSQGSRAAFPLARASSSIYPPFSPRWGCRTSKVKRRPWVIMNSGARMSSGVTCFFGLESRLT